MINNFIFSVGLPGCGKTSYFNSKYFTDGRTIISICDYMENHDAHSKALSLDGMKLADYIVYYVIRYYNKTDDVYFIISADDIKLHCEGYTDEHPEVVHEKSVRLAKRMIELLADDEPTYNVILDGGGVNNHYNVDIINYIKEKCPSSHIQCIYFDTPVDICIDRVNKRDRKIPIGEFYKKNLMLERCVNRYKEMVDDFKTVSYFTNKHLFLDMDGTIVAYQKGKLDEDGNTDFVNSELFLYANPVKHVIDFVKQNFNIDEIYIITAVANNIVLQEKLQWLDKHFPEFNKEHFLWVGNKQYKHVFLKHFAIRNKMDYKDMTLIDDMHETLTKCLNIGMNAVHPSNIESLRIV